MNFLERYPPPDAGWEPMETVPSHDNILLWAFADNSIDGELVIGQPAGWNEPEVHGLLSSHLDSSGVRHYRSEELDGWGDQNLYLWPIAWKLDPLLDRQGDSPPPPTVV